MRLMEEVRMEQEQRELRDKCSFQPEINQISRLIAHPLRDHGMRAEDALIKYGQMARDKIEQKRSEILYREISECRFHP